MGSGTVLWMCRAPVPTLRLIRAVNESRVLSHLGLCLLAYNSGGEGFKELLATNPNVPSHLCFYDLMESTWRDQKMHAHRRWQFSWTTKPEQAFRKWGMGTRDWKLYLPRS